MKNNNDSEDVQATIDRMLADIPPKGSTEPTIIEDENTEYTRTFYRVVSDLTSKINASADFLKGLKTPADIREETHSYDIYGSDTSDLPSSHALLPADEARVIPESIVFAKLYFVDSFLVAADVSSKAFDQEKIGKIPNGTVRGYTKEGQVSSEYRINEGIIEKK